MKTSTPTPIADVPLANVFEAINDVAPLFTLMMAILPTIAFKFIETAAPVLVNVLPVTPVTVTEVPVKLGASLRPKAPAPTLLLAIELLVNPPERLTEPPATPRVTRSTAAPIPALTKVLPETAPFKLITPIATAATATTVAPEAASVLVIELPVIGPIFSEPPLAPRKRAVEPPPKLLLIVLLVISVMVIAEVAPEEPMATEVAPPVLWLIVLPIKVTV